MSDIHSNQEPTYNCDATEQSESTLREQKWLALEAVSVTSHTWNGAFAALANMVLNARKAGATWAEIAEAAFMTETEAEQLFSKAMWHIVIGETGIKVLGHIAYRKDITLSEALTWVIEKVLDKKSDASAGAGDAAAGDAGSLNQPEPASEPEFGASGEPDSTDPSAGPLLEDDAATAENEGSDQPKSDPILGHRDGLLSMTAPVKPASGASSQTNSEAEYYTSDEVKQIISKSVADNADLA